MTTQQLSAEPQLCYVGGVYVTSPMLTIVIFTCVCACEHHKYFYTPTYIRQQQILNFLEFCGSTKLVITAVLVVACLLYAHHYTGPVSNFVDTT